MRVSAVKSKRNLVEGRSFPLNLLFVTANAILLFWTIDAFLSTQDTSTVMKIVLPATFLLTTVALFILKGFYMYSYLARFGLAFFLLIAGFGKLNDPIGFSEILKLYFEDGALNAYLSNWFGWTDYSLQKYSASSLQIAVFIGVFEVVIALMLLFFMFYKLAAWLVFGFMVITSMFSFYNFQCDSNQQIEQQAIVVADSPEAQSLHALSLADANLNVLEESANQMIFSKMSNQPCIVDSGRLGADLNNFLGFTLTHKLGLILTLTGLCFSLIILATQFQLVSNSPLENAVLSILIWLLVLVQGISSSWFWLVFLSAVVLYLALNIRRFGIPLMQSVFSTLIVLILFLCGLAYYVIAYEPLTDFRPYALGSKLGIQANVHDYGQAQKVYVYKHKHYNKERFLNHEQHTLSAIWEDTNYVFLRMQELDLLMGFGLDKGGFTPLLDVQFFSEADTESSKLIKSAFIQPIYEAYFEDLVEAKDKRNNIIHVYRKDDFPAAYEKDTNFVIRKYAGIPQDLEFVNVADLLLSQDLVFLWVVKDLDGISSEDTEKMEELYEVLRQHEHQQAVLGNASTAYWESNNKLESNGLAYFQLNRKEQLKICRSDVCLLVLGKGEVLAKYPLRGLPKYETIFSKIK